ncbi:MAG: hypothetical protein RJA57_339, partial [Bacteroidota bacterium]
SWSPDNKRVAFTHTGGGRVDLYIIDIITRKAVRVNRTPLNTVLGGPVWYDDRTILYRAIVKPASAAPPKPSMPKGPTVQENEGKAAPSWTYQDLIRNRHDEELFAFFATAQLMMNRNGVETPIGSPAIHESISPSPDKNYLLQRRIHPPFSYLVPAGGFPAEVVITDLKGKTIKRMADLPSTETAPSGNDNVQYVPRGFEWREDEAATIVWCMPQDSGQIKKQVEYRDAVYALAAPFTGDPQLLFRTRLRYRSITWGNSELALVTEGLTGKQLVQIDRYNPVTEDLEKLMARNTTDAYGNPGNPVTAPNQYGRYVLLTTDKGTKIFFNNTRGSSPQGDRPFLLQFDVHSKKADTLWRCPAGSFETVIRLLDPESLSLVTRRETEKEMPNYWLKDLKRRIADRQLTFFANPYPQMDGVIKEKIRYKRADGVDLTGDLYLPKGYNKDRDGKLPVLIWAYPAEYNSAADAAQIRGSEHRFTLISGGSPVMYVTQGYAILNNAEMPIVAGNKDKRPNDNFIEQLTMNAEAAIHALDSLGVGDPDRVAVAGHSYGAFMTANLLAHTKLFRAGIARSGAYNRTLTPFGFQNEDRTYWQDPDLYHRMSPFSYADKIKAPLLLVHGELDNNPGTFPVQSERMFNAIKGHGGTVKFLSLPYESHGYQGRENLLHLLQEQLAWLDNYVKQPRGNEVPSKKGF